MISQVEIVKYGDKLGTFYFSTERLYFLLEIIQTKNQDTKGNRHPQIIGSNLQNEKNDEHVWIIY